MEDKKITNVTKGLTFRQADESQSFKNEECCSLKL